MSVLKTNRNISGLEYAESFDKMCVTARQYLAHTPKRKQKWLNAPVEKFLNLAYDKIAEARHGYFPKGKEYKRDGLRLEAAQYLSAMQPSLWILFNVQQFETRRMVKLVEEINKDIDLLMYPLSNDDIPRLEILDYTQVHKAVYLLKLSQLQRYLYGKVAKAPKVYDAISGTRLISNINKSFVSAIYANRIRPQNHDEYLYREKLLSDAITYLNAAQQESLSYFSFLGCQEKTLREWVELLNECHRLLIAVQKSDKTRFAQL